jgi:hypothetical protein
MTAPPHRQPRRLPVPPSLWTRQLPRLLDCIDRVLARLISIVAKLILLIILTSTAISLLGASPVLSTEGPLWRVISRPSCLRALE